MHLRSTQTGIYRKHFLSKCNTSILPVLVFVCFLWGSTAFADVYIIANASVEVSAMTEEEIRDIFIGKRVAWDNNVKIVPVIAPPLDLHDVFSLKFTHRSGAQLRSWWLKLVFSGEGTFPKAVSTEKEMIDTVGRYEGAIGYASKKVNTDKVKTIVVYDKEKLIKSFEK